MADGGVVEVQREMAVAVLAQGLFDAFVVVGLDIVRAAGGRGHDASRACHQGAVLEHVFRRGEHGFAVGVLAVHGKVGRRPRAQVAAVAQAQQARRAGAGQHGNLV